MSDWQDVMAESALAEGENTVVDVDGTDVAIFKIDGQCYAISDVCSHDGGEIASGTVEGDEIICPRHGARFCILKQVQSLPRPLMKILIVFLCVLSKAEYRLGMIVGIKLSVSWGHTFIPQPTIMV